MKKCIKTPNAPAAVGPYNQGIAAGGQIYVSGQLPLIPGSKELASGGIAAQARQTLSNLRAVLLAAGSDLNQVVRTTLFLTDLADFAEVNAAYAEFFPTAAPSRSTVQVAALPLGARLEIDAIAVVGRV